MASSRVRRAPTSANSEATKNPLASTRNRTAANRTVISPNENASPSTLHLVVNSKERRVEFHGARRVCQNVVTSGAEARGPNRNGVAASQFVSLDDHLKG